MALIFKTSLSSSYTVPQSLMSLDNGGNGGMPYGLPSLSPVEKIPGFELEQIITTASAPHSGVGPSSVGSHEAGAAGGVDEQDASAKALEQQAFGTSKDDLELDDEDIITRRYGGRCVHLLYEEDAQLFDEVLLFKKENPLLSMLQTLEHFLDRPNSDAIVKIIYANEQTHWDAIFKVDLKPLSSEDEVINRRARTHYERELLRNRLFIVRERGYMAEKVALGKEDNGCHFLKVLASFSTLAKEAEKIQLRMEVKQRVRASEANERPSHAEDLAAGGAMKIEKKSTIPLADFQEGFDGSFVNLIRYAFAYLPNPIEIDRDPFKLSEISQFNNGDAKAPGSSEASLRIIINRIRVRNYKESTVGIEELLFKGVYSDLYAVHDGPYELRSSESSSGTSLENARSWLYSNWAAVKPTFSIIMGGQQPLRKIRNYFGEKIAFYFSFLGFYTVWLLFPGLIGLVVFLYGLLGAKSERNESVFDNAMTPWFALFMSTWALVFLEFWKRQNSTLSAVWDVMQLRRLEQRRPQWYGTVLQTDPVTGRLEPHFPFWRKVMVRTASAVVTALLLLVMVGFEVVVVLVHAYQTELNTYYSSAVSGVLSLLNVLLLTPVYLMIALKLNEFENHKTVTGFEGKAVLLPRISQYFQSNKDKQLYLEMNGKGKGDIPQYILDDVLGDWDQSGEVNRAVVQYGFVGLFSCAFPLAPLLAFLSNSLEIRFGAYRLLTECQRPFVQRSQGLGAWFEVMLATARVGAVINALIMAFTSNYVNKTLFEGFPGEAKVVAQVIYVIAFEHIAIGLAFILDSVIPDTPTNIQLSLEREAYLERIESELLEKVEFRFALADTDAKFERALETSLAAVISLLGSTNAEIRTKSTSLCSHAMKILKSNAALKVPVGSLLDVWSPANLSEAPANPLILNFALLFLEVGFGRLMDKDSSLLLPRLLEGISSRTGAQQKTLFHIAIPIFPKISRGESEKATFSSFTSRSNDLEFLMDKFLDVVLLCVPSAADRQKVKEGGKPSVGPGLSERAQLFVSNDGKAKWVNSPTELSSVKVGILRFIQDAGIIRDEICVNKKFLINVVAAAEQNHEVISVGENGLKRLSKPDFEDPELVKGMYRLYQGVPAGVLPVDVRLPGSLNLKIKLSGDAANSRLRTAGMAFVQWIARMLIDETLTDPSAKDYENLRGFAFESIGLLSKKAPEQYSNDLKLLRKMFQALRTESKNVRVAVQESLLLMIDAYKQAVDKPEVKSEIEEILLSEIYKPETHSRFVSCKFANAMFPFSHPSARFICILAAADSKLEIREEGRRGLVIPSLDFSKEIDEGTIERYLLNLPGLEAIGLVVRDAVKRPLTEARVPGARYVGAMTAEAFSIALEFLRKILVVRANPTSKVDSMLSDFSLGSVKLDTETHAGLQMVAATSLYELVSVLPDQLNVRLSNKVSWLSLDDFASSLVPHMENKMSKDFEIRQGSILALASIIGRLKLRSNSHSLTMESEIFQTIVEDLGSSTQSFIENACLAIAEIGKYGHLPINLSSASSGPESSTDLIIEKLKDGVKKTKDSKMQELFILTLGYISLGDPSKSEKILDYFFSLPPMFSKNVEAHFTIGEAVCATSFGWQAMFLSEFLDIPGAQPASNAVARDDIAKKTLERSFKEGRPAGVLAARKAICVWLMTVVKYCGHTTIVKGALLDLHGTFSGLIADRDEFVQEVASKALGMIYELGDEGLKASLLQSLVSSFSEGRKIAPQSVTGDTQLFQEGALGTSPDGSSLTTYQSILSLASDLNQPDLVYKFMSLASDNALWNTRKGATMGFSTIAALAEKELAPLLPKIIPRLYIFQFDPVSKVSDRMKNIWKSLVRDPKSSVDEQFVPILDEVLKSMGNRMWRTREASCLAMSDLLYGRQMDTFEGRLEEIWTMCFRALDDIKESVRVAAFTACKTLTNSTVRYCDPTYYPPAKGRKIVDIVVPFFLTKGLSSMAEDVRKFSLSTLLKICKSGGVLLKPHVSAIVTTMLESLSSFEPEVLNYLTFHVDKYNLTQDQLESSRLNAAKSSPIMEGIERCVDNVDEDSFAELVPKLNHIIRKGVGLPTKAGAARFVVLVVTRHPEVTRPHADVIMKSILAAIHDRSPAVRKAFATALGYISRLSSDSSMTKFIEQMKKEYFEAEDDEARSVAGMAFHEVSRYASDTLGRYYVSVLPVSYLGMRDGNSTVAETWKSVWEENTAGASAAVGLYLSEIVVLCRDLLASTSLWHVKRQVGTTLGSAAAAVGDKMGKQMATVMPLLVDALSGRTWDGKEAVLEGLVVCAVEGKAYLLAEENKGALDNIFKVVVREAKKNNRVYKTKAVDLLGRFADGLKLERYGEVEDLLLPLAAGPAAGKDGQDEEEHQDGAGESAKGISLLLQTNACKALGNCFPRSHDGQVDTTKRALGTLLAVSGGGAWTLRATAIDACEQILGKLTGPADGVVDKEMAEALVEGLMAAVKDGKYSTIREKATKAVEKLVAFDITSGVLGNSNDPDSPRARLLRGLDEAASSEVLASVAEQLKASRRRLLAATV
ncbi:hypothetical protein HK405_006790 [Cladochytrium tenue]|nr:hypothetical protein HK405_006790 [Cladochytrium tenue]